MGYHQFKSEFLNLMSTTRSSSSVLQSSNRFVSSPGFWLELEVTNFNMANSEMGYYRSSEQWMDGSLGVNEAKV